MDAIVTPMKMGCSGKNILMLVKATVLMKQRIERVKNWTARNTHRMRTSEMSICSWRLVTRSSWSGSVRTSPVKVLSRPTIGTYLAVRFDRKIDVEMIRATGAEAAPTNLARSTVFTVS